MSNGMASAETLPRLVVVATDLECVAERARELVNRLRCAIDRAAGAQPPPAQAATGGIKDPGQAEPTLPHAPRLRRVVNCLEEILGTLDHELDRLGEIA